MDVLSVEEAWAVAKEIVGNAELIGSTTSYYGSVAQLMEANGWTAVTKGSEVLYYTRPAQIAIESGVKTYTEVATVTDAIVAESGAVTSATATTTGVGVTVAEGAIAGAVAASFGYNVGNKIYEVNPEWWDGLLSEVNAWTLENVPESGINGIVTVLEGVDTVLTFPQDLFARIINYSLDTGVYDSNVIIDVPSQTTDYISVVAGGFSFDIFSSSFEKFTSVASVPSKLTISNARNHLRKIYNTFINESYVQSGILNNTYNAMCIVIVPSNSTQINISLSAIHVDESSEHIRNNYDTKLGHSLQLNNRSCLKGVFTITETDYRYNGCSTVNENVFIGYYINSTNTFFSSSINSHISSYVDGTTKQEDAIYPVKYVPISETYPNWWNKRLSINNGSGGIYDLLPISITDKNVEELGDNQTQSQAQSGTNTDVANNSNIEVVDSSGISDKNNNPDSTDTGNTPILTPSTSIFGIAGVYNPTLEQIKSFTSWLWSENPITQLQQMFSNPMNAIIGLHLIYVTPSTSDEKTIGVGYLDSGVSSKVVSDQYVTIDCGTVTIPSYYNNVNDWNPYTKISCYLPFIGIVKLNTDDLMSSDGNFGQLNIAYKVDVLTGACLAMLKVKRGNSDAILYQYNGSCSVQLPLTSGNYGGIIASLITTAVGVATGITPLAIGGAMSLTHPKADIQRSGQLGANVGAMGIKKPYLIIERPYSKYAGSYAKHIGYPSNNTIKLSDCSGFTRVKSADVNNINTTEEERKMILNLLTSGIYV